MTEVSQHNKEIHENLDAWSRKPLLKRLYRAMHEKIAQELSPVEGTIVELGSGIGNIKEVIPGCLRTDLFPNPWLDRTENAYALSFADSAVSNLILFDVFHHLRYPGTALGEFSRVLTGSGRVLIFEPCLSLLGHLVYGVFHHEPIGRADEIEWTAPAGWSPDKLDYYAAQGNASHIFLGGRFADQLHDWRIVAVKRYSEISYVASGGYSKPQLYPDRAYGAMRALEGVLDKAPWLFATRLLIVLEKAA